LFDAYCKQNKNCPSKYNIVGHSVGGKVALIALAHTDPERVKTVIAFDPVDQTPPEFTGAGILSLDEAKESTVILTLTDGGRGISRSHDAGSINMNFPDTTKLVRHEEAGHLAYTDDGGGLMKFLMPDLGTKLGNAAAHEDAHRLIREYLE